MPENNRQSWIVDAHIHFVQYSREDKELLLERFAEAGGRTVVAVSTDLASSQETRELASRYPKQVHPAYGYHPEQPVPPEAEIERLLQWIRERHQAGERFAIGEVGLPYYNRTDAEANGRPFDETPYLSLLGRFAALAAELDLPIVLHAIYEDGGKACEIVQKHGVQKAHFHWFKGGQAVVKRLMDAGYMISISPDVAYEPEIRELVRQYPLELMMSETDGPWPFEGKYKGQQTEPAMVRDVVAEIAEIKNLSYEIVADALFRNASRMYGLKG
ncbi:TatD family hydrolase [Paenibacillus protaetiae]|uniref:TatD family hydrolase n=1 Tax=Paenibacillus protaetiae TaxID=2509456 RepID=UPI001FC8EDDB|nr:TatD family hydrolase [Paenibacillus protaetiae]